MSARLEPKEAAEAAATLMQAMTKEDPNIGILARSLSAILGDDRRLERAQTVAATVGCFHESQGLPGALALLQPASEPFPCRLSDQELVELLKQPFCVGPARAPSSIIWKIGTNAASRTSGTSFASPRNRSPV